MMCGVRCLRPYVMLTLSFPKTRGIKSLTISKRITPTSFVWEETGRGILVLNRLGHTAMSFIWTAPPAFLRLKLRADLLIKKARAFVGNARAIVTLAFKKRFHCLIGKTCFQAVMVDMFKMAIDVVWKFIDIPVATPQECFGTIRCLKSISFKRHRFCWK